MLSTQRVHLCLVHAQRLLAQREPTATDAFSFVDCADALLCQLSFVHQLPIAQIAPSHAVLRLGLRYLYMEFVFCIVQVIGT